MDNAGDVSEDRQEHVCDEIASATILDRRDRDCCKLLTDPEVGAAATLKEHSKRREEDGKAEMNDHG